MQHTTVDYDSLRAEEFVQFARAVLEHIDTYTVPQYGDKGSDLASEYTRQKCLEEIKKYAARAMTNARGPAEAMRDLLKIAHYSQMAYDAKE